MTPRFFRFGMWDDQPHGVPELIVSDHAKVVFRQEGSKWFDIIRSREGGVMLSDRLAAIILDKKWVPPSELIKCVPAIPVAAEGRNIFPGYHLFTLTKFWDVPVSDYVWPDKRRVRERWHVQGLPSYRLGRLRNSISGALGSAYCDLQFLLLAREIGATNFRFRPLDLPEYSAVFTPPFKVDYLGKQWPPQWYPDGFEPEDSNLSDTVPVDPLA
jgi:hypothetical protein